MISLNNQYSSRKFSPTKSNNPCPICDDITGKCRIASDNQDFVLCMTHPSDADLTDWKYLGETNGSYFAGKYVRKHPESESDRQERRDRNLKLRMAQQKAKRDNLAKLPDAAQRDRLYQNYLQKLDLDSLDRADLVSRGLSELEIQYLGAKSTNSGYILPIKNPDGKILGFQIRLRDANSGRYRWHKPFGISAQQQNGELPLAFHRDLQVNCQRVVLVEGTGVKPYLASKLRGCVAIGASGGQFIASKETLQSYFAEIGAKPELTRLEYAIDAGDITNSSVMRRHEKNLDFLADLGYTINVLWWGQIAKTDDDIDELSSDVAIQLLSVEQFFQIANYQPKPKFSPFQWLKDKLFTKKAANGFANKSQARRSPQPTLPKFVYEAGARLETWRDSLLTHKHVLDASATGTGKSYDAGRLRPELFDDVERIIYISNDSRNVTTPTLQDWEILPARHNGLTNKSGKLRRAKHGETLHAQANCSRTGAISALRDKGVADTKVICETCPLLNACRGSSGDGFGFRHQRAIAFNSKILRSHPASLPSPDEFDYSKTVLVWEEVSESLTTMRQISVDRNDVDQAIALLSRSHLDHKQQIIDVLNNLHGLLGDKSYHGLDFHGIKLVIPEVIDTTLLADLLKPDLSILDTIDGIADSEFENAKGKDKRELAKFHALLKRETTFHADEIRQKIDREVLKQWLVEFLDILSGDISHGDLHIQYEKLTVSLADERLRGIAHKSAANLYLDATVDVTDLQMRLNAPVHTIKQSGELVMPQIFQVHNLGRLGMQRREEKTAKVQAIIAHLTNLDPTTRVIDFKKFANSDAHGFWFRDSRGSNDFKNAKTFVIVGTPCANIAMLRADYVAMTGLHPIDKDPDFAAFVDRHILATVMQCFGRKAGDRFQDGDVIYFLSDFNLGDMPHTLIKSGDITADAMSNLELLQLKVAQVINSVKDGGFDLLNASERHLCQYFEIKRGVLRYHFEWIKPLLDTLYNQLIHSFNENLSLLTDPADLAIVELWASVTELFLVEEIPIKETLAGIFEFFAEHIPLYLHTYVLVRLSDNARHKLFSTLAVLPI
ncbi:hypothetical protein VB774_09415 [Pseudanabaena galeata UHCC 0370]|uniref:Uncharacterized protein n=1 Tax=Pseudanabaena galeata UHCC 0370 TaxID=3110310 RepID=A0ABU5TJL8_9CYAN|nr:hypothetical protein [Pseudanabaena galeata]MEA5477838.1 hypothetical protein [Pseudanabaena galeata UHCC 0370]